MLVLFLLKSYSLNILLNFTGIIHNYINPLIQNFMLLNYRIHTVDIFYNSANICKL